MKYKWFGFIGFHGESLPFNSGLTTVIKSHGSTIDFHRSQQIQRSDVRINARTSDEMKRTHRDGIILIRNPYRAIYGYRHLNDGGHLGLADASKFFGPGLQYIILLSIINFSQLKFLKFDLF